MDDSANNYKSRCDEVILSRSYSYSSAGVVFDEEMSDEEVMAILQELANGS